MDFVIDTGEQIISVEVKADYKKEECLVNLLLYAAVDIYNKAVREQN